MRINVEGNIVNIYILDTNRTLLERIAVQLNTLPEYLYFPDIQPDISQISKKYKDEKWREDHVVDIPVENVLKLMMDDVYIKRNRDFESFKKSEIISRIILLSVKKNINFVIENLIPLWISMVLFVDDNNTDKLSINDMIDKWLKVKTPTTEGDLSMTYQFGGIAYQEMFAKYYKKKEDYENMIKKMIGLEYDEENINTDIKNAIEDLQIQVIKTDKRYKKLDNTKGILYTDFKEEKIKFSYDMLFKNDKITLMEVFNYFELNEMIPIASVQQYYKIFTDFIPNRDWDDYYDYIMIKMLEKKSMNRVKYTDYTDVTVNEKSGVITTVFDLTTINNKTINRKESIERFKTIFTGDDIPKFINMTEIMLNGAFYFPNMSINKYVFLDLVMNDDLFSSILSSDEKLKATKKGSSLPLHFNIISIGHISSRLTVKTVGSDFDIQGVDKKLFPEGSSYIRIKVSNVKSTADVNIFKSILSKLMEIYNEKKDRIIEEYRVYLPNFDKDEEIKKDENDTEVLDRKKELPQLFVSRYSRNGCPFPPTMIREDDKENEEKAGKKVMGFPKDGTDRRYYVCNYKGREYPGIKINDKLSNRDIYPYIPCCYGTDQSKKGRGSHLYNYYFNDIPIPEKIKNQQRINVSDKMVEHNDIAFLPPLIEKIFSISMTNPEYYFVRKGILRNKSSFLMTVLEAEQKSIDIKKLNDFTTNTKRFRYLKSVKNIFKLKTKAEITNYLTQERLRLATLENAVLCKQEMYDKTVEEIREDIGNPEVYFDPKLFIRLMEVEYKMNIIIFNKEGIVLPRHKQGYYSYENNNPVLFIYEHMGSESNQLVSEQEGVIHYPQCEIIIPIKKDTPSNIKKNIHNYLLHNVGDAIINKEINQTIQNIKQVYTKLKESYILNTLITDIKNQPISPEKYSNIKYISQGIDIYGKVRRIDLEFEDNLITMYTSPIPPLSFKQNDNRKIQFFNMKDPTPNFVINDYDIISSLTDHIEAPTYKIVENGKIKELIITNNDNTVLSFPVDLEDIEGDFVEINEKISYYKEKTSELDLYTKNKKLARYLIEYLYWKYSKWIDEHDYNIDDNSVSKFMEEKVIINENVVYKHITKTFSDESSFIHDDKIVVSSEETKKRLAYTLSLASKRNFLTDYKDRTVIHNYFVDKSDFTTYPSQILLEGYDSVRKWLNEKQIVYKLSDSLETEEIDTIDNQLDIKQVPYFVRFGDKNYLAQNTTSLAKASDIGKNWDNNGYNIGLYAKPIKRGDLEVRYITEDGKLVIKNKKGDTIVIKYKIFDDIFYTILLSL